MTYVGEWLYIGQLVYVGVGWASLGLLLVIHECETVLKYRNKPSEG